MVKRPTQNNVLISQIVENQPNPEWTLLYYLRSKLHLCGTKEACGEGGCGACTVLQQKFDEITHKIENNAINACLTHLCSVHGTAIITVEGIGSTKKGLHPVQERIAKSHGTQCGYCTPGFVMSMYALLRNNPEPTEQEMEDAFQGNLCRCTGYRPIVQGYQTLCKKKETVTGGGGGCCGGRWKTDGGGCCMEMAKNSLNDTSLEIAETLFDESEFKPYDPKQDIIFPPELQLNKNIYRESLRVEGANVTWHKPSTLDQLLVLKDQIPTAKLVAGYTEVGIEIRFKQQEYPVLVYISDLKELAQLTVMDDRLVIGSAVTLSNLKRFCSSLKLTNDRASGTVFHAIEEMLHWFAGQQIRNVATIAGNIVTASPISDLNPILMACGAKLNLRSLQGGKRTVPLDESFFLRYRTTTIQPTEIVESIEIPYTKKNEFVWAVKQARRREDDIAIVNACMKISINSQNLQVQDAGLVFGGMAPTTKFARKTANVLISRQWNEKTLDEASSELLNEMKLEMDAPGGMVAYRQVLAQSFLTKFFIAASTWLATQYHPNFLHSISPEIISAATPITRGETAGVQLYQIVPKSQKVEDLVGRPVGHLSSIKHATGEAIYIGDEVPSLDQHYGALVPSPIAHGKILSIDASKALSLPGVVRFLSAKDLTPEENIFGYGVQDEEVFASEYVYCHGQSVGMIIAMDPFVAEKAAKLVTMKFQELPVVLTIDEAIAQKSFHDTRKIVLGDVSEGFKNCDEFLEGEMRIGGQEHFYMETQCCTVTPGEDQELDMLVSCQGPDLVQSYMSRKLGIPANRIKVRCRRTGGSFGGKETRNLLVAVPTAMAAVKLGKSVRTVMTRWEDMVLTGGRNPFLFRYKVGFTEEGRILAVEANVYSNAGFSVDSSIAVNEKCLMACDASYTVPNWNLRGFICKTNLPSSTAFRGYGGPQANIFMESVLDAVAEKLGRPPMEIREMHLKRDNGDLTLAGFPIKDCTLRRCWNECIKNSSFEERRKQVDAFNQKNRWKKRGIVTTPMKHPVGFKKNSMNQGGALVMIYTDGSVGLNYGGTEMGQGLTTKMIQVASRALGGVSLEKNYFSESSTDKVPNATPTCGSFSSDLNGMAVMDACKQLLERLEPFKKANPEGKWEDWVAAAYLARVNLSAVGFYDQSKLSYDFKNPDDRSRESALYTVYGVAVSEVEVDCLTGDHSVLRTDIVIDAGESMNPAVDIGQIEGAFMQGYGLFTMEELLYSPKGLMLTKGPGMYKIPAMGDIPRVFNVSLLRGAPKSKAVFSSKGLGEPPLFLAASVYFAIKEAIKTARKENGQSTLFTLYCPATAEKIRLALGDKTVEKIRKNMETSVTENSKLWAVAM